MLGFDVGSVALKVVVTDAQGVLIEQSYTRTHGRPVEVTLRVLGEVVERLAASSFDLVAGTGAAGRLVCQVLGVPFVNEVICQAMAIKRLYPEVRTLIEMGGQDSKLILLPEGAGDGSPMADFTMNTNCAAGTGSFLDQQASRLGIRIEDEFGELAMESETPPRVAGRCSVFAKSDMIHLQQQAAPMHDIVAGLCMGLARNLKSNLGRGMELARPIAFCGGVAANKGVVHALEDVFELGDGELIVPACHAVSGALGAVLVGIKEQQQRPEYGRPAGGRIDLSALQKHLDAERAIGVRLSSLRAPSRNGDGPLPTREALLARRNGHLIEAYLGVDVGSISTKAAVIDKNNQVLAKIYLMTAGRPLEAVRKVLTEIGRQVGGLVEIKGAATTGSGRYLTGDFIGADLVINEITAQATAAAVIDPQVDTIFEIGGQDSKYIGLDGGVVVDFEMNHACAAGTGSFLEEQAERLGVNIKQQFSQLAFASGAPIRLGERCTVFMESDLLSYQQQGAKTEDLAAGLCYSIVTNYINRVVGHRKIGDRIFFQGGTAFNKGVVAAFQQVTGRPITVPPHHEVTGAIGAAVLARRFQEQHGHRTSHFGGFEVAELQYSVRSFECEHCSNHCEINEVTIPGRDPLFYGSRCDRYNLKKDGQDEAAIPDLFTERQKLLIRHAELKKRDPSRKTVGIPLAMTNYQLLPFWGKLFAELGMNVQISSASTKELIHRGVEAVVSTPCFPVKVAHGHVLDLIDRQVDYIWLPSVTALPKESEETRFSQACPYVQALPYQIEAAIEPQLRAVKLLKPPVRFQEGPAGVLKCLAPLCGELGVSKRQLRAAIARAWANQDAFDDACRARGREVLANLKDGQRATVVISRPYNGCDTGVSLDLPKKLRKLGVLAIPMDFLDLRETSADGDLVLERMYWKYGQRILRAAQLVRQDPRLHAIYLSNFSCGPDSFLISYFKRMMTPKPALVLEVDEHSADAGVVTRLEAFLESLSSVGTRAVGEQPRLYPKGASSVHKRTVYIPWMGDYAHGLAAAFRACGQPAEVMPLADEQTMELGRRACTGKECLPCIITTGDMLKVTQRPGFDPARAAFFMPGGSGPCRFGQYNCLHKVYLNERGLHDVPVLALSEDREFYEQCKDLSDDFARVGWVAICAVEVLLKALLATRPYELDPGQTDRVYEQWRNRVCEAVEKGAQEMELLPLMRQAADQFAAIPTDRTRPRPRIGVVGEIYVRFHKFANGDLLRQLEMLGAETRIASFLEWMYYTNWTRDQEAKRDFTFRQWLLNLLQDRVQRKIERRLLEPFASLIGDSALEPRTRDLLDLSSPYIHPSFQGEAILSVAKIIEYHHEGCHGVVNVMPFSCMPSTIVGGVMKRVTHTLGAMPALSISYDGQQDPTLLTRLEAFVHQARAHQTQQNGHGAPAHAVASSA